MRNRTLGKDLIKNNVIRRRVGSAIKRIRPTNPFYERLKDE